MRACTRVNIRENACVYMHVSKFTSAFVCVRTSECVFVCAVSAFECKHALEWIRVGAFTVSALSCVHARVNTCACVLCLFLFVCVPRANTFVCVVIFVLVRVRATNEYVRVRARLCLCRSIRACRRAGGRVELNCQPGLTHSNGVYIK